MTVYVCSLHASPDQEIPPGQYTLLRFPFEAGTGEPYDEHGMHRPEQPDGSTVTFCDPASGLIWPHVAGWGDLIANFQWEAGDYDEIRDQFVRDPLGTPDYTAVDHRPPSPGMQFFTKHHGIFVNPDVPLGVMVRHNATTPKKITYAQFKLAIHV